MGSVRLGVCHSVRHSVGRMQVESVRPGSVSVLERAARPHPRERERREVAEAAERQQRVGRQLRAILKRQRGEAGAVVADGGHG
eukprot:1292103-Prymnesium_polylepis.1